MHRKNNSFFQYWLFGLIIIIVIWLLSSLIVGDELILPSPLSVMKSFKSDLIRLLSNGINTAIEAFFGLLISITAAGIIIAIVGIERRSEKVIYPHIVMLKATPAVAYAPIIIILTGSIGIFPKILIASMISFFPIIIGGIDGLKSTPDKLALTADSYGASDIKRFRHINLGYTIYGFFSGLKTAAPLSVVGAIVGEYIIGGTPSGLGTFIISNYLSTNMKGVFSGALFATAIGLMFFGITYSISEFINNEVLYLQK